MLRPPPLSGVLMWVCPSQPLTDRPAPPTWPLKPASVSSSSVSKPASWGACRRYGRWPMPRCPSPAGTDMNLSRAQSPPGVLRASLSLDCQLCSKGGLGRGGPGRESRGGRAAPGRGCRGAHGGGCARGLLRGRPRDRTRWVVGSQKEAWAHALAVWALPGAPPAGTPLPQSTAQPEARGAVAGAPCPNPVPPLPSLAVGPRPLPLELGTAGDSTWPRERTRLWGTLPESARGAPFRYDGRGCRRGPVRQPGSLCTGHRDRSPGPDPRWWRKALALMSRGRYACRLGPAERTEEGTRGVVLGGSWGRETTPQVPGKDRCVWQRAAYDRPDAHTASPPAATSLRRSGAGGNRPSCAVTDLGAREQATPPERPSGKEAHRTQ